jgi:hypothetical protein
MSNSRPDTISRWLYYIAAGVAVFSGMGQMPILKRYYIADLPLMGWSQNVFVVSDLHYLSVALLLGLLAWRLSLSRRVLDNSWSWGPRTVWGWTLLTLLFVSGAFKVMRNTGVFLDPFLIMMLDFVHLGSGMAFMFTGLIVLLGNSRKRTMATKAYTD